ncbi:MAG: hydrogenase expression/formation protein HypE [Clostridiales bacterium]|nr:hydrogenase expression/formation protein HypE [Clostridiales bacterium]
MKEIITLAHGSGGKLMHDLVRDVFKRNFCIANSALTASGDDSAVFEASAGKMAFTTDSFVVSPVFFPGGNIGRLAVCGTVNDLATSGAVPLYMSCGFILEEGYSLNKLDEIAASMAEAAAECGMAIVTGDTKVVQKGAADGIFINTSGIGSIPRGTDISGAYTKPGDAVLVTGNIGEHGCAILLEREKLGIRSSVESDCAPLSGMVSALLREGLDIHTLRDPTRGGIGTTLNEIALQSNVSIVLREGCIPVKDEVKGICGLLGLDPLYLACEGRMLVTVPMNQADRAIAVLRKNKYGTDTCLIGEATVKDRAPVSLKTVAGGHRVVDMIQGEQLPRIC